MPEQQSPLVFIDGHIMHLAQPPLAEFKFIRGVAAPSMSGGGRRLECAGERAESAASGPSCIRPVSASRQGRPLIVPGDRGNLRASWNGTSPFFMMNRLSCCAVSGKIQTNLAQPERRSVCACGRIRTCEEREELNLIATAIAIQYRLTYALEHPRAPRRIHSPAPAVCILILTALRGKIKADEAGKDFPQKAL